MATFTHPSGATLSLCFSGCFHYPEPFKATGLSDDWARTDPWQIYTRHQPRLSLAIKIAKAAQEALKRPS